jgi:hypothetical protein
VPGAFTPTCSSQAPGYIEKYDQFKAKGVNEIYILTVNDVFVTKCVVFSFSLSTGNKFYHIGHGRKNLPQTERVSLVSFVSPGSSFALSQSV